MKAKKSYVTAPVAETDSPPNMKARMEGGGEEPSQPDSTAPQIATSAPETGTQQIEIAHGEAKGFYSVHPIACLFPLVKGKAYDELRQSLKTDGQQEPCVVDGRTFLDGRNRAAALNELGLAPRVMQFCDLKTGLTPAAWVMTRNLHRRHLTNDQHLAVVAKYRVWCKEEAARHQAEARTSRSESLAVAAQVNPDHVPEAKLPENAATTSTSELPQESAENLGRRKRGRPSGDRSEAKALAKETKQTRYRAERMIKLRNQSPELATAVEEGRRTLKEAVAEIGVKQKLPEPTRRRRRQDAEAMAVEKAKRQLSKLAGGLDSGQLAGFWKNVAEFAVDHAEATERPA